MIWYVGMNTVAIPTWNGLVSPLFDSASSVLVVHASGEREIVAVGHMSAVERAQALSDRGVETLVCGAVSNHLLSVLTEKGINVISWVRGDVEDVYRALDKQRLVEPRFVMPGCSRHALRCRTRCRRGHGWRRKSTGRGGQS